MPADVFVHTRSALFPAGAPIENVRVSLHTVAGALLTSGLTDAAGTVFLGNRADDTYEVRITPPSPGSVADGANRQNVIVVNTPAPGLVFDLVVDVSGLPAALDANLCRCSGRFIDDAGNPIRSLPINFNATDHSPNLLRDTGSDIARGVLPVPVTATTDEEGYAVIDLIKEQQYLVHIGVYADYTWEILVPNLSAAPLPDVVLPYAACVEYRDDADVLLLPTASPTLTMTQGETVTLSVTSIFRSGLRLEGLRGLGLQGDANHYMINPCIIDHKLKLTALSPGVIKFSVVGREAAEKGYGIRVYPPQAFTGDLTVTVLDNPAIDDIPDPGTGALGPIILDSGP